MIFTSIPFWAVFVVFLTIYAILRRSTQTGMMLYVSAVSLGFFYLANGWLAQLLPLTALFSWALTSIMRQQTGSRRKTLLTVVILILLAPLVFFKYADAAILCLNRLAAANFPLLQLALPLGISFYTFQAVSYAVDVYRGRFQGEVSFLEYLFYLTFFPVVFAGPITRAETFFPQIRRRRPLSQYMAYQGLWLILMGMIKKAVIADYIAQYNNWIFDSPLTYSGFECLMGLWGFSLQIYLDFSGYSDISIGIAALMGIRLRDNFRFPYQSRNVTEFWHRWHISLSTWFRDYVYIPLGGNRRGIGRTALNCLITLLVAGIWHGSSLMFVLWGLLHGLALVVHKSLLPQLRRIPDVWCIRALSTLLTITFITVNWVLFRAPDLSTAGELLGQMFTSFHPEVISSFVSVRFTWVMMTLLSTLLLFVSERAYNRMTASFVLTPWLVKLLLFTAVLLLAVEFHTSSITPFLYYKF